MTNLRASARQVEPFEHLKAALSDRYILERELGTGMATVFLAHDPRHNRKVAVKIMRSEIASVIGPQRFLREIETTANLQHPHILPLFDSGRVDGTVFYVMPTCRANRSAPGCSGRNSSRSATRSGLPARSPRRCRWGACEVSGGPDHRR
jgi:hypothetical protein